MNKEYYDNEKVYEKYEYNYREWGDANNRWEYSPAGGRTFTVKVLTGPDSGAFLDFYYYSEARLKLSELLSAGICAVMRLQ